jgi:hypothetical protein
MREMRDSVLRAVSLVVTDRRWAAPLSAMALGFGLFLGVAIGPGAAGGLATGPGQILAVAPAGSGAANTSGGEDQTTSFPEAEPSGGEAEPFEEAPLETEFAPEPLVDEPEEEVPAEEGPAAPAPEAEEPETEAVELTGTVVRVNPAAGSYTLATKGGELVSLHAEKLPPAGTKLRVEGTPLANNTFAEAERERAGAATRATLRGVVTHVDPDPAAPAYTISGRGSSILVHVPPEPAPQLPALGAYATVSVQIQKAPAATAPPVGEVPAPEAPPCAPAPGLASPAPPAKVLVQRQLRTEPEPATYVDLAGIVSAVCPATGQLLVSADDLREGEADLLLAVPSQIKTAKLKVGDSILATATVGEDAALTLAGLASDERLKGAEDAASAQGDLKR